MQNISKKLALEQIDRRIKQFSKYSEINIPVEGWIYSIRQALGISLKQLGKKMQLTPAGVKEMEKREKNSSVTIKSLKDFASALELKFVYAFIPKEGSLEKMIEKRALEIAKQIVLKTSHSMALEDQQNVPSRIKKAIKDRAQQIKNEMPKYLWD
ncbi:MAG: mobile mystery protein A [Ignavibacteriaceae bacterium]